MQADLTISEWKFSEKIFFRFVFVYVILFINSFSFPHHFIPDVGKHASGFFLVLAKWSARNIFGWDYHLLPEISSDSTYFYVNAFNLIFIAGFISGIWSYADRRRTNYVRLQYWFFVLIRYYLALQLFEYGFQKFFKWQFYFPEPNTLFTTIGNTPKDLLYWSTMGTSRFYSMFTGAMEIFAAVFLLFRRTFLFGTILSLGIMINVLMINCGFDISVKLYSMFLILLCLILIFPFSKKLFRFFFSNEIVSNEKPKEDFSLTKHRKIYLLTKILTVGIILGDTLSPYFISGNFNGDNFSRPEMWGAYDVSGFTKNSKMISNDDSQKWKRIFIHSRGYFITQDMNDKMEDYDLEFEKFGNKMIIQSFDGKVKTVLNYSEDEYGDYNLKGKFKDDSIEVHLKKIDLSKLPINGDGFHWTIDE